MKKRIIRVLLSAAFVFSGLYSLAFSDYGTDFLVKELINKERMRLLPVPADFRNYFLLQSVDDTTKILIGDFVGAEKLLCLVRDEGSDNTVDGIIQYYPDKLKFTYPAKPSTAFFTDIKDIKMQIIDGSIFRKNYSSRMNSLDLLKQRLEKGTDIYRSGHGYTVKVYDPDKPSTIMSEFYFSKKDGRYDLVFATYYYMVFNTRITTSMNFSVYCRNSKDPVVAEVVESLYKLVPGK